MNDDQAFADLSELLDAAKVSHMEFFPPGKLPVPEGSEPDPYSHLHVSIEGEEKMRVLTKSGEMTLPDMVAFLRSILEENTVLRAGPLFDH